MRTKGGWYEEDCDWCIPFVVFENELKNHADDCVGKTIREGMHMKTFRAWHPDSYEQFTGIAVKPGESVIRDEQIFCKKHEHDLVVVSAVTSKIDKSLVECYACVGGRKNGKISGGQTFLVPGNEYDKRSRFGFIIDPLRHQELIRA